jgi:gliding motility-associated-like protein
MADPVTLGITGNTTFVVTITEEVSIYGCYNKDSIVVTLFPQTGIVAMDDTFAITGTSVQLEATGGPFTNYRWEPETGLDNPAIYNPIATPRESIRYYVYATSEYGCIETDSVFVEVIENLKAYNAFSPNGDGINDYFEIENSERFPEMRVDIYNRWGQLLYSTVGYGSNSWWDGNSSGAEAPVGTYYYVIIPYSGARPITGNVTIIR